jgi:hypothetical protein
MKVFRKFWKIWARALGEKAGATVQEADHVAIVRTIVVLTYIITNCFIIASVIRHW